MWAVGSLHIWGSVTGYNGRPYRAWMCEGQSPPCSGQSISFAQIRAAKHLLLSVEICSACYFVDNTLETVVGNAICADGAAAFLLAGGPQAKRKYPQSIDFETFIDTEQIEEVGLQHRDGKLRIVLGASIQLLAAPMIETALQPLLQRHGLSRSHIRFWVVHPGGRKVIDNVQQHFRHDGYPVAFLQKRIAELWKYVVSHCHVCLGRGRS
jgi:hypothetical protein